MKFRIIVSLLSLIMLTSGLAGQEKPDSQANAAKQHLGRMEFKEASLLLNKMLEIDSSNIEANYLKAEIYLLYGSNKYQDYKERLQKLEADEELTILNAKEAAFLGLWSADSLLKEALKRYPGNAELELILFLQELENGNFYETRIQAGALSDKLIMKFMPYLALFNYTRSFHQDLTLAYLDTLENMTSDFYHSKNRPLFEILEQIPEDHNPFDEFERFMKLYNARSIFIPILEIVKFGHLKPMPQISKMANGFFDRPRKLPCYQSGRLLNIFPA